MTIALGVSLLLLLVQLPSDLSPEEVFVLLEACSGAVEPDVCVTRSGEGPTDARIERIGPARFSMELALETNQQQRLISREFTFKPEDAPLERARALGLSLGLLARNARAPEPAPESPPESPTPLDATLRPEQAVRVPVGKHEPLPPAPPSAATPRSSRWLFELQAGIGYETGLTTLIYQGDVRLGFRPIDALAILLSFSLTGGHDEDPIAPLDMRQLGGSLGVGYSHRFRWGRIGAELEGGLRNTAFSSDSALDRAARSTFVVRAQLPLHVHLNRWLYVLLAPQVLINGSPTTVYWDGSRRAQSGYVVPSVNAGLGLAF
jgi:hypothetical protein